MTRPAVAIAGARRSAKAHTVYSVDSVPPFDAAFYSAARSELTKINELTIPPRDARAFSVPAGHFLRIVSVTGAYSDSLASSAGLDTLVLAAGSLKRAARPRGWESPCARFSDLLTNSRRPTLKAVIPSANGQ